MHMTSDMKPSMFTVEIYDLRDREWDLMAVRVIRYKIHAVENWINSNAA